MPAYAVTGASGHVAAAFLERAAVLTPEPAKRPARALAAAQAKVQAGAADAGLDLLTMAEAGPLGELERARADLMRAQVAYVTRRIHDAPPLLLAAAPDRILFARRPRPSWTY